MAGYAFSLCWNWESNNVSLEVHSIDKSFTKWMHYCHLVFSSVGEFNRQYNHDYLSKHKIEEDSWLYLNWKSFTIDDYWRQWDAGVVKLQRPKASSARGNAQHPHTPHTFADGREHWWQSNTSIEVTHTYKHAHTHKLTLAKWRLGCQRPCDQPQLYR